MAMVEEEIRGESALVDHAPMHALSSQLNQTLEWSFFEQRPRLLALTLIMLFALAGVLRLYRLQAPGMLIDREYTTAVFARDFYFEHAGSVEAWRKEIAHIIRQNQPVLEPPVTEFLLSLIYRAAGSEQLVLGRLLTSSFWLLGGIFLYKSARAISSTDAAVFATAFYLFAPLSILLSRSLQPDALMMLLFLISLFGILKYYETPSDFRLVAAAAVSGLALLYRPLVLFGLLGVFTALAIERKRSWKRFIDRPFLLFVVISLLPMVLYYGYGIFVAGYQRWKVDTSFQPHLLLRLEFWREWLLLAIDATGFTPLIGALLGMAIVRKGRPWALLLGLWIGYFIFGLVFTVHIHTHGYYHAQLIPIAALALGPVIALIPAHLRKAPNKWYRWLPIVGAFILLAIFGVREVRGKLGYQVFESERTAIEIGEIVNHSSKTVFLARYYGMPLQFMGEFSGAYWPRKTTYRLYGQPDEHELSIEERLDALGFSPQYFIITDFREYSAHHSDLKEFLEESCSPLAITEKYLIYHACSI